MAKLFGCAINVEAEEEGGGGSSIPREVPRSGIQPDGEAMGFPVCFPPVSQREINPYFRFLESNSDAGSASMDSESDLQNCFIDFFDRESYEMETVGEFYMSPNQRLSSSDDFNFWGLDDPEEEIELGLGIGFGSGSGSGSGEIRGDSGWIGLTGDREIDAGQVEVGTGLTPVEDDLFGEESGTDLSPVGEEAAMVADEELEWEDLQNGISWVQEPVQVRLFSVEEEEEEDGEELSLASRDGDREWEVLLPVINVGFFEETEDIIAASDLMDLEYGVFLDGLYEYGENDGDYDDVLARTFDDEVTGSPPASKRVVDELPVVEVSSGNMACAICKDEIVAEEKVKRLPCRHYYHGECIIPWLGIRNTCPVCRYELPTDDLEYESRRRSQRLAARRDLMSE
ncbi:unnamed protein product [Thlaspi arvense]|uniref:RING-type E3 ubiquitin transferase n=1 Tax=Thlaspi arvense TaxID=13288 RepID=A0AAU9SWH4_THLAR|nr:unnamed protein product [Thlaspi arvense]